MDKHQRKTGSGHGCLFLISFLASLAMSVLLGYLLYFFAFLKHDPRQYKVALFVLPQVVLFGWVAREMWRGWRR